MSELSRVSVFLILISSAMASAAGKRHGRGREPQIPLATQSSSATQCNITSIKQSALSSRSSVSNASDVGDEVSVKLESLSLTDEKVGEKREEEVERKREGMENELVKDDGERDYVATGGHFSLFPVYILSHDLKGVLICPKYPSKSRKRYSQWLTSSAIDAIVLHRPQDSFDGKTMYTCGPEDRKHRSEKLHLQGEERKEGKFGGRVWNKSCVWAGSCYSPESLLYSEAHFKKKITKVVTVKSMIRNGEGDGDRKEKKSNEIKRKKGKEVKEMGRNEEKDELRSAGGELLMGLNVGERHWVLLSFSSSHVEWIDPMLASSIPSALLHFAAELYGRKQELYTKMPALAPQHEEKGKGSVENSGRGKGARGEGGGGRGSICNVSVRRLLSLPQQPPFTFFHLRNTGVQLKEEEGWA